MNFHDLSQALRRETQRRLSAGEVTQQQIATQTGFRQAHISNFLNGRRALSLEGLDRLLRIQNLEVQDLIDADLLTAGAVSQRADHVLEICAAQSTGAVPLLPPSASLAERRYPGAPEWVPLARSEMKLRKVAVPLERRPWQRIVAVRVTRQAAEGISAYLSTGSVAVIDRHDFQPPWQDQAKDRLHIYASMLPGGKLRFSYIRPQGESLIFHSADPHGPLALIASKEAQIIGRVCSLFSRV